jgi:hypothetical protein
LPVQRGSLTLDKVLLEFFEIFWAVFVPEATGGVSGNYRDMTGFCTGFDKNGDYGYATLFIRDGPGTASIGLVGVRWGRSRPKYRTNCQSEPDQRGATIQ